MKELDRSKFDQKIVITCLKVQSKDLSSILKHVKSFLFKKPNLQPVIKLNDHQSLIRLNPTESNKLIEDDKFKKLINDYQIEIENNELNLNYDNFSSNEILNSVLSENNLGLSSYSLIGHIIHLNLKDDYEPYKKFIGQVLLDKNPSQSLVLNKIDKIDNTFRYFNFDVIAKRDKTINTIVQVNEYGIKFKMDFAKVYWNPRLSTEHNRIIMLLNRNDIVYDVFAGVGPFSIPAAKKKQCKVFANDLNPESFKYLNENIKLNKVNNLKSFNLDGRDFINEIIKENLIENWIQLANCNESINQNNQSKYHIIMNLPAIAIEFLDAFIGLTADQEDNQLISSFIHLPMPIVYCYCFHQTDLDKNELIKHVKNRLNYEQIDSIDLFYIRKVAPNKDMYRITFQMPRQVLFAQKSNKRLKKE